MGMYVRGRYVPSGYEAQVPVDEDEDRKLKTQRVNLSSREIRTKLLDIDAMIDIGPCRASDWTYALGARISQSFSDENGGNLPAYLPSSSLAREEYMDELLYYTVRSVMANGRELAIRFDDVYHREDAVAAYRPALDMRFTVDEKKKTVSIGKYTLPLMQDEQGQTYFELGAYPQTKVHEKLANKLDVLLKKKALKETGNQYTARDRRFEKRQNAQEFELAGKRYVHHEKGWFEVQPVAWVVDGDMAYAKQALFSGVEWSDDAEDRRGYSASRIRTYLREQFDSQIMQSFDFVRAQRKKTAAPKKAKQSKESALRKTLASVQKTPGRTSGRSLTLERKAQILEARSAALRKAREEYVADLIAAERMLAQGVPENDPFGIRRMVAEGKSRTQKMRNDEDKARAKVYGTLLKTKYKGKGRK